MKTEHIPFRVLYPYHPGDGWTEEHLRSECQLLRAERDKLKEALLRLTDEVSVNKVIRDAREMLEEEP